ncbi:MAG: RNA polymerase sigma factor [Gemmatimonadota bacterium]
MIPFSVLGDTTAVTDPAVDPDRFLPHDHPRWPHHWKTPPQEWSASPEDILIAEETRQVIMRTIAALPPAQRKVITLRDLEGWNAEEVCNLLGLTASNQRVLLQRASSRVRSALEAQLG